MQTLGRGRKDVTKQYKWRECNLRYRSCKLVVKGERMQFDYKIARIVLYARGWKSEWK